MEEEIMAQATYADAVKYLKTLQKGVQRPSRFNCNLRYNICVLCFEKLFVAYIAHLGFMAEHHVPLALFNEVKKLDPGIPEKFKEIALHIGRFESICSLDGFGYQTPTDEDIQKMIVGLTEVDNYVGGKIEYDGK